MIDKIFEFLTKPMEIPTFVFFLIIGVAIAGTLLCLLSLFFFGQNPARRLRWQVLSDNVVIEEYNFFGLLKALKSKKNLRGLIKIRLIIKRGT